MIVPYVQMDNTGAVFAETTKDGKKMETRHQFAQILTERIQAALSHPGKSETEALNQSVPGLGHALERANYHDQKKLYRGFKQVEAHLGKGSATAVENVFFSQHNTTDPDRLKASKLHLEALQSTLRKNMAFIRVQAAKMNQSQTNSREHEASH